MAFTAAQILEMQKAVLTDSTDSNSQIKGLHKLTTDSKSINKALNALDKVHKTQLTEINALEVEISKVKSGTYTKTEIDTKIASGGTGGGGTSTTENPIVATGVNVGNITDGTTIPAGTTLDQFIQMLVQKKIAPTYTKPSVSLSKSPNINVFEQGASTTVTFTPTFNKNDAGNASRYAWSNGTNNTGPTAVAYTFTGTTTASVTVTYAAGAVKNDNFGNPDSTGQITAGTASASSKITAVDPIYYGVGTFDASTKNGTKVVESKPSTKKYSFTTNNDSVFIASPYNISKIDDPNGFDNTNSFTKTTQSYTRPDGSSVTYNVYTSGKATISGFEYTFTFN